MGPTEACTIRTLLNSPCSAKASITVLIAMSEVAVKQSLAVRVRLT
jgi:hypothetical protein